MNGRHSWFTNITDLPTAFFNLGRKEQTQQTPNRARKEEEDPCRTQKAPQHRPSWNRKVSLICYII